VHDLPASLRLSSPFPFVGRSAELERLRTLIAAQDGALVLYGACDAVVQTPYGPFGRALEHLARVIDPIEMRAALAGSGGELTRLLAVA
jgi:hypothetical protein